MVFDFFIVNIKGLVQVREKRLLPLRGPEMAALPVIENAYMLISDGRIAGFGSMNDIPAAAAKKFIDAKGRFVFPSFVDSHTHLIFPASREEEFVMKIKGASYQEIAAKGGGILNSARKLAQVSEDELYECSLRRIGEIIRSGTGAVEIKSGYGLSLDAELKMLRVAKRLKQTVPVAIKTTFLGAHAVPEGKTKKDYVREIIDEMIPAVAAENLADYVDVFCETGFFDPEETERIVEAGKTAGMKPRIHANQLSRSGGVEVGIKTGAVSVDHLENIGEEQVRALANSNTLATTLPGAAFFLNLNMPPARTLIENNVPIVIASDFNPGSSPSGNMPLMVSLACIRMKLTPEEAINAATFNGACALELQNDYGSISEGKIASIFITYPMPSIAYLPYSYGSSLIEKVILQGKEVEI
jgi:imidazolonepropionase